MPEIIESNQNWIAQRKSSPIKIPTDDWGWNYHHEQWLAYVWQIMKISIINNKTGKRLLWLANSNKPHYGHTQLYCDRMKSNCWMESHQKFWSFPFGFREFVDGFVIVFDIVYDCCDKHIKCNTKS